MSKSGSLNGDGTQYMYLEQLGSNIVTVNIHLPYVIENKVLSFINTTYTCP